MSRGFAILITALSAFAAVYGHLAPGYLRAEVDRLRFGAVEMDESAEMPESAAVELAANSSRLVHPWSMTPKAGRRSLPHPQ